MNEIFEKPLPHHVDSERAILSSILLDNETLAQAKAKLIISDFHLPTHRILYEAFLNIADSGLSIDPNTLDYHLRKTGQLEEIGGQVFIGRLLDGAVRFSNISSYCEIVLMLSIERDIIKLNWQANTLLFDQESNAEKVLNHLETEYQKIRSRIKPPQPYEWLGTAVGRAILELDEIVEGVSPIRYATGFPALDKALGGGFAKRRLYVIAARTSVGKSTLMMQAVVGGARVEKSKLASIFSLEMSLEELGHRFLHIETRIESEFYQEARFNDEQRQAIIDSKEQSEELKIAIFDEPEITPSILLANCLKLKKENGRLDLIAVDYLSLMRTDGKFENRTREIGSIVRRLKIIAGILDCPVVTAAQINRDAEKRGGKLQLTDLRDSDDIALDSDCVLLINTKNTLNGILNIELDAAKMRGGKKFAIKLGFDLSCGRFISKDADQQISYLPTQPRFRNAWEAEDEE